MSNKNHEVQIEEAMKRENDAIHKVLEILDNCPVPVTQSEVIRRVVKENAFLGVRKLGRFFPVIVAEHNNFDKPVGID